MVERGEDKIIRDRGGTDRQVRHLGVPFDLAGGDLALSARWDEVMRGVGIGDVAVVTCRDALGCWGWLEAYRDGDDRPFGEEDIEFFACVGSSLGAALRRGLGVLPPAGGDAYEPSATGALVLGADLRLVSMTAGARAWVGAFPLAELFAAWGMLPAVIYPLATRVRAGGAVAQAPEPPCGLERNGSDVVRQRLSG